IACGGIVDEDVAIVVEARDDEEVSSGARVRRAGKLSRSYSDADDERLSARDRAFDVLPTREAREVARNAPRERALNGAAPVAIDAVSAVEDARGDLGRRHLDAAIGEHHRHGGWAADPAGDRRLLDPLASKRDRKSTR